MKQTVEFIGRTKDGDYGRKVDIEGHDPAAKEFIFQAPKVITENGYVDVTVKVDPDGKLLAVMVERTNVGL